MVWEKIKKSNLRKDTNFEQSSTIPNLRRSTLAEHRKKYKFPSSPIPPSSIDCLKEDLAMKNIIVPPSEINKFLRDLGKNDKAQLLQTVQDAQKGNRLNTKCKINHKIKI